jgi:serine/threonine protein kinase
MRGGVTYGQGVHGRVIDIASSDPTDCETLHSFLSESKSHMWSLYVVGAAGTGTGYHVLQLSARSPLARSVMRAVVSARGRLVAKMFDSSARQGNGMQHMFAMFAGSPRDAFLAELVTNVRIVSAYGQSATQSLTTVRGLELAISGIGPATLIAGIAVDDMFCTFQSLCESPSDMVFSSRGEVHSFVRDLLDGFQLVHAAEILHGDIKLDNIMRCDGRYKIIDWGASGSFAEIRKLCALTQSPRNCASPMAWFAWGGSDNAPDGNISHALHLVMNAKLVRRTVFLLPGFRRLVDGAYDSYVERVGALFTSHNGLSAAVRLTVIRELIPSFDLYNFGVVIASIALSSSIGASDALFRQSLIAFSTRLMYYAHPEYVGNDAAAAAAWWGGKMR